MALSWKDIKELQEKKEALKQEAEKIYQRSATGVKAEDQKEYDAVLADMEVVSKRIANAEKLLAHSDNESTRSVDVKVVSKADSLDEQRKEFQRSILTSSVSGSIIGPTFFADSVTKALSTKVGMIEAGCTVLRSATGTPFYYPTVDDTSNTAQVIAEGAARSVATDPTLANKVLNGYTYSSDIIKVSPQMIRDNYLDFEQLVIDLCSERLARKIAYDTILGDGSSKITGIMQGLSASVTSTQGFSTSNPFSYAELAQLVYTLDAGHRRDARVLASTTAVAAMAGLTWNNSGYAPVWAPGVERKVEGLPIQEIQDMATLATSSKSVVVINPKKYVFRFVGAPRISILKELYAVNGLWGILVEQDCDGKLVDASAVKALACKAS
jgi:HK97 family phage major capsid protein